MIRSTAKKNRSRRKTFSKVDSNLISTPNRNDNDASFMSLEDEDFISRDEKENFSAYNMLYSATKSKKKRNPGSARNSSQRKVKKRRMQSEEPVLNNADEERLDLALKYKNQGNKFYAEQDYDRAVDSYSSAASLDPYNPVHPGNRAAAKLMLGHFSGAAEDCELALAKDNTYSKARIRAVRAYIGMGDVTRAKTHLEILSKSSDSETASNLWTQVVTYDKLIKNMDMALAEENISLASDYLEHAKNIAPGSTKLWFAGKIVYLVTNAVESKSADTPSVLPGLRADLQQMIRGRHEECLPHLTFYADMMLKCAFVSEAKVLYTVAQECDAFNTYIIAQLKLARKMEHHQSAGAKAYTAKNYCEAVKEFDEALKLDVTNCAFNGRIYFRRAAANVSQGFYRDAVIDCTNSLRNIPSYHKARVRRAHAYIQCKNFSDAIRDLRYVNEMAPTPAVQRELRAAEQWMEKVEREKNTSSYFNKFNSSFEPEERSKRSNFSTQYNPLRSRNESTCKKKKEKTPLKKKRKSLDMNGDHYQILGVERNASTEVVKKAYKKRALKYHPDKNQSPSAETKFKRVGEAYRVLKSPSQRRIYDQQNRLFFR